MKNKDNSRLVEESVYPTKYLWIAIAVPTICELLRCGTVVMTEERQVGNVKISIREAEYVYDFHTYPYSK